MPKSVKNKDPMAEALDSASPFSKPTKIELAFQSRPEVLDSIVAARMRKLSFRDIARVLSSAEDMNVSPGAVAKYLEKKGIT